ncbi:MAG: hypothetical protein M3Q05_15920 [Bacteroidota bacterium]|nr:hypothetical protein [Bacteroidota bacterium]
MKIKYSIIACLLFDKASLTADAHSWSLVGNSGINTGTNFIVTKDAKLLVF